LIEQGWKDVTDSRDKSGNKTYENPKTGEKVIYDKGKGKMRDTIIDIIQTLQGQTADTLIKMEIQYMMVQDHHIYILKNGGKVSNASICIF